MSPDYKGRVFSFERAHQIAEEFEGLLLRNGLAPTSGSSLERMTLSIYDVLYHREPGYEPAEQDVRSLFSDLVAHTELALQLLQVRQHPDFPQIVPHLHLLNEGEAAQNRRADQLDQAANKIFELLAACYAMRCGSNITLDHPKHSRGDNPDVLATMRNRQWGIACKVLHSLHPESIIQNIEKGLSQIDRSTADVGIVFLNLKNVIDHEKYWSLENLAEWKQGAEPIFQTFIRPEIPMILLQGEVTDIGKSIERHVGGQYLLDRFAQSRALNGILLYAHVTSGVVGPQNKPFPMSQRWLTWAGIGNLNEDEEAVLECINRVAQDVP